MDEANKIDDFRREWLRQHRAHSDWQAIIKPCYDNMTCGKVKRGWEKANRTNSISLLSNDEVKDAHSDFDRCPRGGGLRPKFLSISIFLGHTLPSKITASSSTQKLPEHFARNERFLPAFPSPLLSGYALDKQTGHGRGRDLVTISIFSLPRVVRSINVQCLPHPLRHRALIYGPDQPIRQRGETKTGPICSRAD